MVIVSSQEACKIFNCSYSTLKRRIKKHIYPKPIRNNMRLGFNKEHISKFFQNHKNRASEPASLKWE